MWVSSSWAARTYVRSLARLGGVSKALAFTDGSLGKLPSPPLLRIEQINCVPVHCKLKSRYSACRGPDFPRAVHAWPMSLLSLSWMMVKTGSRDLC